MTHLPSPSPAPDAAIWQRDQLKILNAWTVEHILATPHVAAVEGQRIEADALQRGDPLVAAEAINLQAQVAYNLDNLETSARLWQRAEELALAANDPGLQISLRARWGVAIFWLGQTGEAERLLRESLAAARNLGDTDVIMICLTRLATICSALTMVHEAIELHAESMDLAIASGRLEDWTMDASNLSLCYLMLHDLEAAKQTCHDALEQIRLTGRGADNLPYLYQNLATAEEESGDLDEAMTHYLAAVDAAVDLHDVRNECMALVEAGRLAWIRGDMAQGQRWFQRVIDLQRGNPGMSPELLAQAHWGVEATTGGWTTETAAELASLLAAGIPAERDMRIFFYDALAESYLGLGDHEAANRIFQESIAFRTAYWNETMRMHAYSSAKALQAREARRVADDERARREEVDQLLQQVVRLNAENEALIAQLQEHTVHLEHLSRQDALTGLMNRRGFTEILEGFVADNPPTFAVALADIDNFKTINDTYSHHIGDRVLREVANIIRSSVRSSDITCRYGGEEFVMLLKDQRDAGARVVAERVRLAVEQFTWESIAAGLAVTMSFGVWSPPDNEPPAESLHQADLLLYQAKRTGRNRVVDGPAPFDLAAIRTSRQA